MIDPFIYEQMKQWEKQRKKIIEERNHILKNTVNRIPNNINLLKHYADKTEEYLKSKNIDVEYIATKYDVDLRRTLPLYDCLIDEERVEYGVYEYEYVVRDGKSFKELYTFETIDEAIEKVLSINDSSYTKDVIKKHYWDLETE